MEMLQDPPPGFDAVAKVFAMAKHLPTTRQMNLQVGLARDGVLFARGRLDGYRQVNFFSDHLRKLGWREHLLGGDDEMFDCDMMFSPPPVSPQRGDADPSFIRRSPVELWGTQAGR